MTRYTDRLGDAVEARFAVIRRALEAPERTPRTAVVLGRLVGIAFAVCFLTGLYSHVLQHPLPWPPLPTRPVQLYAWSQGLHVATGTALVPLLLAKLWIVYPKLFAWPPVRSIPALLERGSIAALVSTSLVQLVMGVLNIFQWYPWPFSFRGVHWALAWVIIGLILLHVGVKLPIIVRHWRREQS